MSRVYEYSIFLNMISLMCELWLCWCLILYVIYSCFYYFGRHYIYTNSILYIYIYSFLLLCFLALSVNMLSLNLFGGSFVICHIDVLIRNIVIVLGIPLIYCTVHYFVKNYSLVNVIEYTVLIYILVLATCTILYSSDIISLFLCIELQSMVVYILLCLCSGLSSISMGIRYFILGTIVSLVYLFCFTFIYYLTGISSFIDYIYISYFVGLPYFSYIISMVYVLFLFKLYIYPFHFIGGDLYRHSPTYILIFISSILYFVYLYLFVKLVSYLSLDTYVVSTLVYITLALATLTILVQTDIRAFIGFGTSVHSAFIVYIISLDMYINIYTCLFYALIYIITIIGFFIIFMCFHDLAIFEISNVSVNAPMVNTYTVYLRKSSAWLGSLEHIADWSGLSKTHKWIAFLLAFLFWSISGLPPFSGFFAKLCVLMMCYLAHNMNLLIFMLVISIISSLYYLKVIKEYFYVPSYRYAFTTFCDLDLLLVFVVIIVCSISVFLPEMLMYIFY